MMVKITAIEALKVSNEGNLMSESYYKWVRQRIRIEKERLPRFKHLLAWYLKHCHNENVKIVLTYSEIKENKK